jgi:hypothetical protein
MLMSKDDFVHLTITVYHAPKLIYVKSKFIDRLKLDLGELYRGIPVLCFSVLET